MLLPSLPARSFTEAGPRLFAMSTSTLLRANWVASAVPIAPDPMIE
jgi:hypothetical protein